MYTQVFSSYQPSAHPSPQSWRQQFDAARVHVQWDPERSIRGADLGTNSIQVGLSRHVVTKYVEEWVTEIEDLTPLVRKIHTLLKAGQIDKAKKFLPPERVYGVGADVAKRLKMDL